MHCNQIYCYRNAKKQKNSSVGTIEEEKKWGIPADAVQQQEQEEQSG